MVEQMCVGRMKFGTRRLIYTVSDQLKKFTQEIDGPTET